MNTEQLVLGLGSEPTSSTPVLAAARSHKLLTLKLCPFRTSLVFLPPARSTAHEEAARIVLSTSSLNCCKHLETFHRGRLPYVQLVKADGALIRTVP